MSISCQSRGDFLLQPSRRLAGSRSTLSRRSENSSEHIGTRMQKRKPRFETLFSYRTRVCGHAKGVRIKVEKPKVNLVRLLLVLLLVLNVFLSYLVLQTVFIVSDLAHVSRVSTEHLESLQDKFRAQKTRISLLETQTSCLQIQADVLSVALRVGWPRAMKLWVGLRENSKLPCGPNVFPAVTLEPIIYVREVIEESNLN